MEKDRLMGSDAASGRESVPRQKDRDEMNTEKSGKREFSNRFVYIFTALLTGLPMVALLFFCFSNPPESNLITNGFGEKGSNANFSQFAYLAGDRAEGLVLTELDTHIAQGSFRTESSVAWCDQRIPVREGYAYRLKYLIKASDPGISASDMLVMFDADGNVIENRHVNYMPGTTTALARELKDGDTVVYLQDASQWRDWAEDARRGFIFWDYTDGQNTRYAPETYSRHVCPKLWEYGAGAIDTAGHTVRLAAPWDQGTVAAGTALSQCADGDAYSYANDGFGFSEADVWQPRSGRWMNVWPGTVAVTPGWKVEKGSDGSVSVCGVQLREERKPQGTNLIANGLAERRDNTNFSAFTYREGNVPGSAVPHTKGSFSRTEGTVWCDERIPAKAGGRYSLSYKIRTGAPDVHTYDMLVMFDADGNVITDGCVLFLPGTTTALARELRDGDTVVYLTDVSGWKDYEAESYRRGFILWDYADSAGKRYEPETYSRHYYWNLWQYGAGAIDRENNTITLAAPWHSGTVSAGTALSQSTSGSTYSYGNLDYVTGSRGWAEKTGVWTALRPGTAYVTPGWRINFEGTQGAETAICEVVLLEEAADPI